MKTMIQAAAVTLFAASTAQAQQAVQWRVQDGGNGHWYQVVVVASGSSWTSANSEAAVRNGYLASLRSSTEATFVRLLANATVGAFTSNPGGNEVGPWLGATRIIGTNGWQWTSGETWGFTQWCSGEPSGGSSEPYVHLMRNGATSCWNDRENNAFGVGNPSFVIEWSADCNGDGIVDYGQCRDGSLPDTDRNNIPDCCESGLPCPLAARQWRTVDGGNGHWYGVLRTLPSESPESLFSRASMLGGHAATIGSASENAFCAQFVVAFDGMLIGVRKLAGTNQVAWITGEPVSFVNWRSGEGTNIPERYALMLASDAAWLDTDLTPRQVVLVEFDADCNADGIVDFGQIRDGTFPDSNGNGVPDCCDDGGSCCIGDILVDGLINGADLGALLSYWGPVTASPVSRACDLNGDGVVNGADIGLLLSNWGSCL